jgi:hypothetical protein
MTAPYVTADPRDLAGRSKPGGWYERTEGNTEKGISEAAGLGAYDVPLVPLAPPDHDERTPHVTHDGTVQRFLESAWGADEHGTLNPCPIVGHTGTAKLIHQVGDLRVACCSGRWRSLAEVWAGQAYRRDVFLQRAELAIWNRLIGYLAGTFPLLDVPVPTPEDLKPRAVRALNGYKLLIGLRWSDGPHIPVAYSVKFASAWNKHGNGTAQRAIAELIEREIIWQADCIINEGHRHDLPLYLPVGIAEALPSQSPPPIVGKLLGGDR